MSAQPGRNDPCPCGSGSKYKKCCLEKDEAARVEAAKATAAVAAAAASSATPGAATSPTVAKTKVQPQGVSNRAPPPARRRSV